jgi:methylenetetrahydrofolate dehydrogenase (NADP+)/methenyltetrahydrofolate cyclohydrolase
MIYLDGKKTSATWLEDLASENFTGLELAILLVGDNPASLKYIERKQKAAAGFGILVRLVRLAETAAKEEILAQVTALNEDPKVGGFIVQMPLPVREWEEEVVNAVDPIKDIDGLTARNLEGVKAGTSLYMPATALAVKKLLNEYDLSWSGKNVSVVGQGQIAGRPISDLAEFEGAIVTRLDKGDGLESLGSADFVISAVGKPGLIKAVDIAAQAVVVDVGTTLVGGKLKGDVDSEGLEEVASFYTPVPGGVGPMTVAALLSNFVKACGYLKN